VRSQPGLSLSRTNGNGNSYDSEESAGIVIVTDKWKWNSYDSEAWSQPGLSLSRTNGNGIAMAVRSQPGLSLSRKWNSHDNEADIVIVAVICCPMTVPARIVIVIVIFGRNRY